MRKAVSALWLLFEVGLMLAMLDHFWDWAQSGFTDNEAWQNVVMIGLLAEFAVRKHRATTEGGTQG